MKAYVTSIGEPTTELCVWSLERNGFKVYLMKNAETTLWDKLKSIYENADEDFVRVDADVIVNQSFTPKMLKQLIDAKIWWWQFQCFDWFRQNIGYGGIQYIYQEALPALRENIEAARYDERPETSLSRIREFYEPRRFDTVEGIYGLHNYKNDIKRVRKTKERREQKGYDWQLAERLNAL